MTACDASIEFVEGLNDKFTGTRSVFSVQPGRRYDRIVRHDTDGHGGSVHAFIERTTGHVHKPEGWRKPHPGRTSCSSP